MIRPAYLLATGALLAGAHPALAQTVSDPMAPSRLPGALSQTTLPIPALAFAAASTRSVPVLATPAGALPSVEFEVVTTGGAAPISFSVAGGTAAAYFEIVPPASSTPTRVPTAAELAAAQAAARVDPTPAGTITRRVRFKGTSSAAGLPSTLPVQIRATDALGGAATIAVTAYPFAPRISEVVGQRTAHESQYVSFRLDGLGRASGVQVDSLNSACGNRPMPNVTYAPGAVAPGSVTVGRWTTFRTASESCAGLQINASLRFPDSTALTGPVTLTAPTFAFTPRQVYAYEDTWALRDFLGFKAEGGTGTCSGDSTGTAGTHPVGVLKSDGDIVLAIRSGPLGTECPFVSQTRVLPDGFTLRRIEFERSDGPNNSLTNVRMPDPPVYCSIGGSGGTVGGLVAFDFTRGRNVVGSYDVPTADLSRYTVQGWERPLLTADGVSVHSTRDQRYTTVLLPMLVRLRCVMTASNTEYIRLRLKRIEFTGPPGLTFP